MGGQLPPPLRTKVLMYYYAYITLYYLAFLSASPYLSNSSTVPSRTYYPQPAKALALSSFLFNFLPLLKSDSPLRTLFPCCPTQMVLFILSGSTYLWDESVLKFGRSKKYNWCFQWKTMHSLEQTFPRYLILAFYCFGGILQLM